MASRFTEDNLRAYLRAVEPYDLQHVAQASREFAEGMIPRERFGFPDAAEFSTRVRLLAARAAPKPVLHNGLLAMDFDHGTVDMRGLTEAEQDIIIKANGMIDGRNAALLPRAELHAALDRKQIENKPSMPMDAVKPAIRRMAE